MQGFKCKIVLHKIIVLCSETEQINPIFNARVTGLFFFSPQEPGLLLKQKKKTTALEKLCYLSFSERITCLKQQLLCPVLFKVTLLIFTHQCPNGLST